METLTRLAGLEQRLVAEVEEAYNLTWSLRERFATIAQILIEMRGSPATSEPFRESGADNWSQYVKEHVEPRFGFSASRVSQIINAWERKAGLIDVLKDVERARMAQLIASRLPESEHVYRAIGDAPVDEALAVIAAAQEASGVIEPPVRHVQAARKAYEANGHSKPNVQEIEEQLLLEEVKQSINRLPVRVLMELEQWLADLIVEKSHESSE